MCAEKRWQQWMLQGSDVSFNQGFRFTFTSDPDKVKLTINTATTMVQSG